MVTLVAVFQNADAAAGAEKVIKNRGLATETRLLPRRADGPEVGEPPVITGPGYGLSAPHQAPPQGQAFGAGTTVGATIGGTAGLLAATYTSFGLLTGIDPVVSTLVGAGLGSVVGGLAERGAAETPGGVGNNERDTQNYAGTVRIGGVLLVAVCADDQAGACRNALQEWGPLELREHPGGPAGAAAGSIPAATNRSGSEPGPLGTSPWPGAGLHGAPASTGINSARPD